MTKIKNLRRDIETMTEKIRLHWQDLSSRNVTAVERDEIRQDIRSCIGDLENLLFRLDHLDPKSDSDTTSKSSSPEIKRAATSMPSTTSSSSSRSSAAKRKKA